MWGQWPLASLTTCRRLTPLVRQLLTWSSADSKWTSRHYQDLVPWEKKSSPSSVKAKRQRKPGSMELALLSETSSQKGASDFSSFNCTRHPGWPCNLICAYASKLTASPESKDKFYDDLAQTIRGLPEKEPLFILGDFNARGVARRCANDYWLDQHSVSSRHWKHQSHVWWSLARHRRNPHRSSLPLERLYKIEQNRWSAG